MVEIEGITHQYGAHVALRDVSVSVREGRLFALLGPNGGGKTTLFRILSTLIHPTSGRARVAGFDTVRRPADVRQRLGVVFQQTALDDALTVAENLRVHGALYGLHGSALEGRIDALLDVFEIGDRKGDRVQTLSGGLQRRADLARGLLHTPSLLLLDEPTTGLDPAARFAFWQALGRLRRQEGTTMLVATHLMDEAERGDDVAILDRGRLVAAGTPNALKEGLGSEMLWLEGDDVEALHGAIRTRFDLPVRIVGDALQLSHPRAHTLLPELYGAFGDRIASATVRRPTLEDVFMVLTGTAAENAPPVETEPLQS